MLNNGVLLGGLVRLGSSYTSVIQTLYNVLYPDLKVDLGQFAGTADSGYGLLVKHSGVEALKIGAGFIEGALVDSEIISDLGIIILSNNGNLTIGAGGTHISLYNDGDIQFSGASPGGTPYSFTGYDLARLID